MVRMNNTVDVTRPADELADAAVELVGDWLTRAGSVSDRSERVLAERLSHLIANPEAVAFTMCFVDRVARPENHRAAAHQLATLVEDHSLPGFLSRTDRMLLLAGARIAPLAPRLIMPMARRRMRALVGHLVADADPDALTRHLERGRNQGYAMNVNLLGEAILGEAEAARRFERTLATVARADVDYVSVKISAIASQLDLWAYEASLARIEERLGQLYDAAGATQPPTFINLDMEEYKDLDLTVDAFIHQLDARPGLDAGIVLQAYLPDSFAVLQRIVEWANQRHGQGGGVVKVRLVKGANLAMERVEAEIHGWEQAPYATKVETDANYKRCIDWALHPGRLSGVRIGIGSHNLFDIAWTHLLGRQRSVADKIEFEMLQGMAPSQSEIVHDDTGTMLLYTPVVSDADFDVAIGYLFRRLEENASEDNFLHSLFSLTPGSNVFRQQEAVFRQALAMRWQVSDRPRRSQRRDLPVMPRDGVVPFQNEPDTDPVLAPNREWIAAVAASHPQPVAEPITESMSSVDDRVAVARNGAKDWAQRSASDRRAALLNVAAALVERRSELISAMIHEAAKTFSQADPEVSEAIDFARYYADRALDTEPDDGSAFAPLGIVNVVPPWNFPVAIPAGGVLAALAAGNAVILKPAPETPRCAELVAEACWASGIPRDVLQFIRTPDDAVGRHLVTHPDVDGVILTGSWDTAQLFRSWKPDLRLFAETSGKNAIIVTPHADLDLAAADVVRSAFGHSGQKCSAASLAILVGDVFTSERFLRQVVDATESMALGYTDQLETVMGPVIRPPEGPLRKALTDPGGEWLVRPRKLNNDDRLWSPGILANVQPGSWFHETECFGPVLGMMFARDLDHAIELQNASAYGLTGGIHSLDPHEVDWWLGRVEVGNAYINRHITGAIVRRQPFGGWKRSVVGAGAKAGGPNYVTQLGTWTTIAPPHHGIEPRIAVREILAGLEPFHNESDYSWLLAAAASDAYWWDREFSRERDESGLVVELNAFRYRTRPHVVVRIGEDAAARDVMRSALAAAATGAAIDVSAPREIAELGNSGIDITVESDGDLIGRLAPWSRIRLVGGAEGGLRDRVIRAEIDLVEAPVVANGRYELRWYLREQAISRTLHRFGNLVGA